MSWSYVCPKCKGTEVYFAKKQILTGIGGIWGNKAKEVQRPFCMKCDIEANSMNLDSEGNQVNTWTPRAKVVNAIMIAIALLAAIAIAPQIIQSIVYMTF